MNGNLQKKVNGRGRKGISILTPTSIHYVLMINGMVSFYLGGEGEKGWVIIEKYKDKSTEGKKFAPMQTKGIYTHMTYMKSYSNLAGFVCGTNTG